MAQQKSKLDNLREGLRHFLHEKNFFTSFLEVVEKYTRISREYIFISLFALLIIYLIVGYGAGLVVNLLGFAYPAYKSCKAIDSEEKDDDTQWLTYWVVYASFTILEHFTDYFLAWIPFYFLAKCLFLVWCMLPMANNGAGVIYRRLIKPFITKNEKAIDEFIGEATALTKEAGKLGFDAVTKAAKKVDISQIPGVQEGIQHGVQQAMFSNKDVKSD